MAPRAGVGEEAVPEGGMVVAKPDGYEDLDRFPDQFPPGIAE